MQSNTRAFWAVKTLPPSDFKSPGVGVQGGLTPLPWNFDSVLPESSEQVKLIDSSPRQSIAVLWALFLTVIHAKNKAKGPFRHRCQSKNQRRRLMKYSTDPQNTTCTIPKHHCLHSWTQKSWVKNLPTHYARRWYRRTWGSLTSGRTVPWCAWLSFHLDSLDGRLTPGALSFLLNEDTKRIFF